MLSKKPKAFILVENYIGILDRFVVLASYGPGKKFNNAEKLPRMKTNPLHRS
jgi:hypothetical protein